MALYEGGSPEFCPLTQRTLTHHRDTGQYNTIINKQVTQCPSLLPSNRVHQQWQEIDYCDISYRVELHAHLCCSSHTRTRTQTGDTPLSIL